MDCDMFHTLQVTYKNMLKCTINDIQKALKLFR